MSENSTQIFEQVSESSQSSRAHVLAKRRVKQRNQLLVCFLGISLLTICFIYSLQSDQFLISNKISAYIIFAAWIFMKTNDPGMTKSKMMD